MAFGDSLADGVLETPKAAIAICVSRRRLSKKQATSTIGYTVTLLDEDI